MTLYENEILDTGGGVKNAIPFFKNKNLLITNSDVFWLNKNIVLLLILYHPQVLH